MIKLKNKRDIKYIKKAIQIGEHILNRMSRHIEPGITPKKLDRCIEWLIWINRAKPSFKGYKGFPTATCISTNEGIIHGILNNIPLKEGDIVKIDLGINYKNYYSDQAKTYIVGEPASKKEFRLVYATKLALDRATFVAREGNTIGDISRVIENTAKEFDLGILRGYGGHGVGIEIHSEPFIPNRVGINKDIKLIKNMVIAIEPLFVLGKGTYTIAKNGFDIVADGLSAHFEATVVIK